MTIDHVLFDHDDTLLPTVALRGRALGLAMRELTGREVDGEAVLHRARGGNLETMTEELADGDGELAARIVKTYRRIYYRDSRTHLAPFDGIETLLRSLRGDGIGIAVVTSKLGSGARDELAHTGLDVHVELTIGGDEVERQKPDPEPLLTAMNRLGARPGSTLMVGDTAADILGARAAGVRSVGAMWGVRDRAEMLELAPDFVANSPGDVRGIVRTIRSGA